MISKAKIIGTGSYLPERILTNQDFEKMVDTTDEWIVTRTGMKEASHCRQRGVHLDHGFRGCEKSPLICQTRCKRDRPYSCIYYYSRLCFSEYCPALIQRELGATQAAALDIQAACTGFLYETFYCKGLY